MFTLGCIHLRCTQQGRNPRENTQRVRKPATFLGELILLRNFRKKIFASSKQDIPWERVVVFIFEHEVVTSKILASLLVTSQVSSCTTIEGLEGLISTGFQTQLSPF